MCLFVHPESKSLVAESDIEVYKVLLKNSDPIYELKLVSPYQACLYEIGETYFSNFLPDSKLLSKVVDDWDSYPNVPKDLAQLMPSEVFDDTIGLVEYGIHTFKNVEDAKTLIQSGNIQLDDGFDTKIIIVKCIIPKGSLYYFGSWILHPYPWVAESSIIKRMDSYCSKNLKIIEIIGHL